MHIQDATLALIDIQQTDAMTMKQPTYLKVIIENQAHRWLYRDLRVQQAKE